MIAEERSMRELIACPCTGCIHAVGHERGMCDAFPEAIPDEIWRGRNQHDDRYPGDNGITHRAITEADIDAALQR